MKLQKLPRYPMFSSTRNKDIIHSRDFHKNTQLQCQEVVKENQCNRSVISKLLDRRWALMTPEAKIQKISLSKMKDHHRGQTEEIVFSNNAFPSLGLDMITEETQNPSFYVVRDDLLHPLINGNKARKLDALIPLLEDYLVTDVVTCGGCQSAHAAAVAVSCAERGLRSHLLLRGEQPDIPTGYNLISTIYGNTIYVPRSFYSKREEMLVQHANLVAGSNGSVISFADILTTYSGKIPTLNTQNHEKKVIVIKEGAGDSAALLGLIRLVEYLSQTHLFGRKQPIKIVVDSGTGTTAVGLALGAICLGLKWEVIAVMLADTEEGYKKQEQRLISDFKKLCSLECVHQALSRADDGIVNWVERIHPRKRDLDCPFLACKINSSAPSNRDRLSVLSSPPHTNNFKIHTTHLSKLYTQCRGKLGSGILRFGNILKGEVGSCQKIAQQTGVLLDPIYTLAGWELATELCQSKGEEDAKIVMLHTGGTLGMFGLAQRYKSYFQTLKDPLSISKPLFS